jgi:hypothetical protein
LEQTNGKPFQKSKLQVTNQIYFTFNTMWTKKEIYDMEYTLASCLQKEHFILEHGSPTLRLVCWTQFQTLHTLSTTLFVKPYTRLLLDQLMKIGQGLQLLSPKVSHQIWVLLC